MTRKQWAIIGALALAVACELCTLGGLVVWDSSQQTTTVVQVPEASPAPPTETPTHRHIPPDVYPSSAHTHQHPGLHPGGNQRTHPEKDRRRGHHLAGVTACGRSGLSTSDPG